MSKEKTSLCLGAPPAQESFTFTSAGIVWALVRASAKRDAQSSAPEVHTCAEPGSCSLLPCVPSGLCSTLLTWDGMVILCTAAMGLHHK